MPAAPRVTAVVLAYGDEPYLQQCVEAVLGSDDVDVDVILVDNGADTERVHAAGGLDGVSVVTPGRNLGYAGGCNAAVPHGSATVLVFVNSDAIVSPGCLRALVASLEDETVGLVSASVRLADSPALINSAGNPVHYLFFSWAGAFGEEASAHACPQPVASVSGATFAMRRSVWQSLGGFDEQFFAYGEDVDLSWRAWQAGYRVLYEPRAVSAHHYEFSRNPRKMYLLERNRLVNLLTLPEQRTRRRLAPIAVLVEAGMLLVAVRDGWARQKWEGWMWLVRHRDYLRQRRSQVEAHRRVGDGELAPLLCPSVEPPAGLGQHVPAGANKVLSAYWQAVNASLVARRRRRG